MDTYPEIFYTIYQTTNLVNGKTYIGAHKTVDPWDSYLGSGVALLRAIRKHGKESFSKEVLAVFDNPEDMWATEARLVNESFISTSKTYNARLGGPGDFSHASRKQLSEWGKKGSILGAAHGGRISGADNVLLKRGPWAYSEDQRKIIASRAGMLSAKRKRQLGIPNGFAAMSENTRAHVARTARNKQLEQFPKGASMYITDGNRKRMILKSSAIPEGWRPFGFKKYSSLQMVPN